MDLVEILGYSAALLIGLSLGLIGSGGSILAVPVLAYLFSLDEKVATAYSLFIVGASSLLGALKQHAKGYVDWRTAFVFGTPAIIGVTLVRYYVIPLLPELLFSIGDFNITRRMAMFGLFAALMIPAAFSMLKEQKLKPKDNAATYNYPLILLEGLIVGAVTGLIGAGGGFLIIPALVLLSKAKMKIAVGTSLVIVAGKSLLGFFLGDALKMEIDWNFLVVFTLIAFVGIFLGSYLSNFINGKKLKKGFGFFVLTMAVFIFYMEFVVKK